MATTFVGKYQWGIVSACLSLAFVGLAGGYYFSSQQWPDDSLPAGRWVTESYGADSSQVYDVFRPSGERLDAPMVIIVHGGGADEPGDKAAMRSRAKWYAKQGAVVVTPNYRYGEGRSIPDVACALLTAQASAARFGVDPEQIVVHGFSYGGWLTSFAVYAQALQEQVDCPVEGSLKIAGFIGESTQFGMANLGGNFYQDIVPDGRDGAINYLDVADAQIPALLLHGTRDPKFNHERAIDFAAALNSVGGRATAEIYEGFGHSAKLPDNARTQRDVLNFLESLKN
jgi:dienelactone hydrolase